MKTIDLSAPSAATIFAVLYGQSKMFKTSLMLLAPEEWRPMLYLDTDRGVPIRATLLAMTEEQRMAQRVPDSSFYATAGPRVLAGLQVVHMEDGPYYEQLYQFATEIAPKSPAKTIVIDTVSRIGDNLLVEAKTTALTVGTSANAKQVDNRPRIKSGSVETIQPTEADYGMAQHRIMEFIGTLVDRNPDKHIFLLSHEKTGEIKIKDTGAGRILAGPRTIGNALIEVIPSIADIALRLEPTMLVSPVKTPDGKTKMEQTQSVRIRTKNHNIYIAGDRSGLFLDEEPLDPKLFWDKMSHIVRMASAGASPTTPVTP